MANGKNFFMDCIKSNFDKIMSALRLKLGDRLPVHGNLLRLRPGPRPKFTDVDVIVLSLTAACMGYNSECHLFEILNSRYQKHFPYLISRRQYNDRRKNLFAHIEDIRKALTNILNELTEIYAVDSMPLPVCKLARMNRNKRWLEAGYAAPDKGYCASQDTYLYGYKLHASCSPSGVIETFDIAKASMHDVRYLNDISDKLSDCIVTGDRGYIDRKLHKVLWEKSRICMEVPGRSNQKHPKKVLYALRRIRKRIETVFSQLSGQFKIQQNYAKSFEGFRARVASCIAGITSLQMINIINGKSIGHLKYALR